MMTGLTTRPLPDDDTHREPSAIPLSPDHVLRLRAATRRGTRAGRRRTSARRLRTRPAGSLHACLRRLPLGRGRSRIDRCRIAVRFDHIGMAFDTVLAVVGGGVALGGDRRPLRQAARSSDATDGLCDPGADLGLPNVACDGCRDVAASSAFGGRRSGSGMEGYARLTWRADR
jgi:hypothetical protein